jgi:signal transduction histidine kinase
MARHVITWLTSRGTFGRVTNSEECAAAEDPGHVWIQAAVGWEIAFWAVLALGVIVAATDGLSPARVAVAISLIVVIGAAFGDQRRYPSPRSRLIGLVLHPRRPGRRVSDLGYLLVVVVCTGLAIAIDSNLSLLLSIGFSQMWMYGDSIRQSLVLVTGLAVSSGLGLLAANHWQLDALKVIAPSMGVSLTFSVLLGIWISRIIEQSRERAHLITQLEATRAELGQAHHAQGVMAERERMAQEIHDTLAQGYTSIIMLSQLARDGLDRELAVEGDALIADRLLVDRLLVDRLTMIEDVARENLGEARTLVAAFAPVSLDGATLTEAVQRLARRFGVETAVAIDVAVTGDLTDLSRDREVVLLRTVQEALANVRRHACARLVTVNLTATDGQIQAQVRDDGVGFDPADPALPWGFGLSGMRDRAGDAGGRLDLVSAPGRGTTVSVSLPFVCPLAEALPVAPPAVVSLDAAVPTEPVDAARSAT